MKKHLCLPIIMLFLLSGNALAQVSRPGIGYDDSWAPKSSFKSPSYGGYDPQPYEDYNKSTLPTWKSLGLQDRYEPPPARIPPKRSAEDLNPNGVTIYDNKGRMTNCMSNFDGSYYCYSTGGRGD